MPNPISNVAQAHAAVQPPAVRPSPVPPKPQPSPAPVDTVRISAAAQALQETLESSVQTAKEAGAGDIQAQHLLAREAAAKANG